MLTPLADGLASEWCGPIPHPSGGLLKVVSAQVPGPHIPQILSWAWWALLFYFVHIIGNSEPPALHLH